MSAPAFGKFFLPGPTEVLPEILEAMSARMIPHRGRGMVDLLNGMAQPLKDLFRTDQRVVIGSCSATGFMEMAVRSGVRHRVLSVVSGAFGERFAAVAAACGREVVRLEVPLGECIEPDMLRDAIRRSDVDAVSAVHSETSTGALAPIADLAKVVSEFDDVFVLVDAVTSVAGSPVETAAWNLDFVFTGSQKALALPPGLALGVASPRMLERARALPERGAYLDLVAYDEAFADAQPTNTPAISLFFALDRQLRRIESQGGVRARWERHDAMRRIVEDWIGGAGGALGLTYLPREGRRSWTVSCLKLPGGKTARPIVQALAAKGWTIGSGYARLKETTIRLGHMGDHQPDSVHELLATLEEAMR